MHVIPILSGISYWCILVVPVSKTSTGIFIHSGTHTNSMRNSHLRGRLLKAVLNLPGLNLTLRFTKPEVKYLIHPVCTKPVHHWFNKPSGYFINPRLNTLNLSLGHFQEHLTLWLVDKPKVCCVPLNKVIGSYI